MSVLFRFCCEGRALLGERSSDEGGGESAAQDRKWNTGDFADKLAGCATDGS